MRAWLFNWTEVGAGRVGIIQSLVTTCRLHDVHPYHYLVDVLQRARDHPAHRVDEVTPRLWKANFGADPMLSSLERAIPR